MKTTRMLCLATMLAMQGSALSVKSATKSEAVAPCESFSLTLLEPGVGKMFQATSRSFPARTRRASSSAPVRGRLICH